MKAEKVGAHDAAAALAAFRPKRELLDRDGNSASGLAADARTTAVRERARERESR
jgi:hypothetical protein